jgi:hypothetical protein
MRKLPPGTQTIPAGKTAPASVCFCMPKGIPSTLDAGLLLSATAL